VSRSPAQFAESLTARFAAVAQRDPQSVRLHEQRAPRWTVVVTPEGAVAHVLPHPKPKAGEKPYTTLAPREAKSRAGGIQPLLVTDNAQYVLGLAPTPERQEGAGRKHAAYLALLEQAASIAPELGAIAQAASTLTLEHFPAVPKAEDLITFHVGSRNPHLDPRVQDFWIAQQSGGPQEEGGDTSFPARDSVTGAPAELATNGPPIGRLPGGQQSMIYQSKNAPAFSSYGDQTLGVSAATLQQASQGVRLLLANPQTSYTPRECGFTLLHWLSDPEAADPWLDLNAPTPEYVHGVLTAERPGQGSADENVQVNLVVIGESGSRLMVKDHQQTSLAQAQQHVQAFRRRTGGLSIEALARTLRTSGDRPVPRLVEALYQHALMGKPLPRGILSPVMARWLSARRLSSAESALVQVALQEELNLQHFDTLPEPLKNPYALGHYVALAGHTHRRIKPDVGVTVVDRLFRLFAIQPVRAYAQMSRALQPLLSSHRRKRPYEADRLSVSLAAATERLTLPLPTVFTLEQQAAFALGYDHGNAALYVAAREAKTRRATQSPTGESA